MLLSLVKKGIFKSDSSSVIKSEYDYAGFSSFAFEICSDKIPRCHNDLKCLFLPVEIICLSCYRLWGAEGLGVVMALINALIENLWRAKQHLPTKLMVVVSPWFILALTAACAACTSGTRTRLATAVHWNWWKFIKIAQVKVTFLKLFDFSTKYNWVKKNKKAAPCKDALHYLLCAAVHVLSAHPGGLRGRWGCGHSWVLLSARHACLEGLAGTWGGSSLCFWELAGFSPFEEDRSLNADSCSLNAKGFGVSRGLSRGDAAGESALYWTSGEGRRAESARWS